jgi:type I restriction enzyme S subunit
MGTLKNITSSRYSSYKDSRVDWLGEIPSSWSLTRLGTRFEERKTKVSDKDFPPLSVTKNGTIPQLDSAAKSNDGDNRKLVKTGDFVINSRSDRKGSSGIAHQDGSVSLIYIVIEPKGINPTYCNYLLKSYNFVEEFYRMGHGIVADLWTTRYDEMKAIMVGIPTIEEQAAIADFLDRKTALVDQAIGIKQKQIELLKERRQILIHKAVTRGLNPNVKMKDSGVEWIGEIPVHWEVKRLKELCKAFGRIGFRGYTTSDLVAEGDGAITISPSNIKEEFMTFEKCSYLSWNKYDQSPEIQIFENDVLMVKTGSTFGKTGIVKNLPQKATINPQLLVMKEIQIDPEYFYTLLKTSMVQYQVQTEVIGSTIPTISETKILNFKVAIPAPKEMKEIVSYNTNVNSKFAIAISLKEQEIEKLKEYKATLINSAVTGKIKVYNDAEQN